MPACSISPRVTQDALRRADPLVPVILLTSPGDQSVAQLLMRFEPFIMKFQGAGCRRARGPGIGLSLTKRLAERVGGIKGLLGRQGPRGGLGVSMRA